MDRMINRRDLFKSGLLSLGSAAIFPRFQAIAYPGTTVWLDRENRIYHSPLLREHLPLIGEISEAIVKLNANENPYGPPMTARKAAAEALGMGNRYPWQQVNTLVDKIAAKEGVASDQIIIGPGSTDLLEKVAVAMFRNGGNLVSTDPTFMSLVGVATSVGAEWRAVPCQSDWSNDFAAIEKAMDKDTKLVYLCNPNNPVGSVSKAEALADFCNRVSERVPVFVDEAYLELAGGATESMVSLLKGQKNVIIARTFSKLLGMAGLRIGYLVALPKMVSAIKNIVRGSMSLSCTTVQAALAALDDEEFKLMTINKNTEVRQYLCEQLREIGYDYIPSYTNFVIFPLKMSGKAFLTEMMGRKIAVRSFDIKGAPWCRVSIGTIDEVQRFVKALKTLS